MVETIRVLVAADNLLARAGLAALLDSQDSCLVVGQATSDGLGDAIDLTQPDIVVADMGWQATAMLDALAAIARPDMPVVALITDGGDAPAALTTLSGFGLYGLLLNENDPELLQTALQAVYAGLIVIDPALAEAIIPASSGTPDPIPEALTQRENDVLQLLAQGLTNKAIAHQLGITDHTVKFHVNAIMTKLSAQSRTEAVVIATRAGLIIL